MHKTLVIALREYMAAVKTKSFLVSMILMPVLMGAGILFGRLAQQVTDTRPKRVVVIDHTASDPRQAEKPLYQVLIDAANERNEQLRGPDGRLTGPPFLVEGRPADQSPRALDELRYELSEEIRRGDLFAFIEIGPNIITAPEGTFELLQDLAGAADPADAEKTGLFPGDEPTIATPGELQDRYGIRYTSKSTTYIELQQWILEVLQPEIYQRRLARTGVAARDVLSLIVPPMVVPRALAVRTASGEVAYEKDPDPLTSFVIPIFSVFLIFSVVMTAASPLTTNIVEEKQLRIAEVLLGSVQPFELMLGKLLGGVGVSLTLAAIYFAGGLYAAAQFGVLSLVTPSLIAWFMVFAALATLMYGAMFITAGAAVTNLKEAQNYLTPIILLVAAPLAVLMPVIQNPDGPVARIITWFPLTTPVAIVLRQSVPPGIDTIEKLAAGGLSLLTTLALVWIAGRIFRFGMLHTDKAAAMKDIMKWVVRGR